MSFARYGNAELVKQFPYGVSRYEGPLTLEDDKTVLRFVGLSYPDKPYEFEIVDPNSGWAKVGEFTLKPFEQERRQDVFVPNIGSLRAWIGKTRKGRFCIKFVLLDEKGRAPAPRPR